MRRKISSDKVGHPLFAGARQVGLAQHAVREARQLARNVKAAVDGRPPSPFIFRALGTMASLGHTRAVARVFGLRLTGVPAWWVRRTYYLFQIRVGTGACALSSTGTVALFFRPDITKVELQVEREQVLATRPRGDGISPEVPAVRTEGV